MSTRKIMNAKDLSTNELIYFRGHAKATYMSDGTTTVEDAINAIDISNVSAAYPIVEHAQSEIKVNIAPNMFHIWEEMSELSILFEEPENNSVANEYVFQFTSGATATTLTIPDGIKWANDAPPTIAENMIYQVSILNGLASVLEFSNAAPVVLITFYYNNSPYSAEEGMTWEQWCNSTYNNTTLGIYGNMVMAGSVYPVNDSSGMQVYGTDVIIENEYYVIGSGGGN